LRARARGRRLTEVAEDVVTRSANVQDLVDGVECEKGSFGPSAGDV
jgi:hypothetical protein